MNDSRPQSEWVAWHAGYEGDTPLAKRLRVVQRAIRDALDAQSPGRIHVISCCAGDGRDLLGALVEHPRASDVTARLVELDPHLIADGRQRVHASPATIEYIEADAAQTDCYVGAVPADLVLVCGVFGNITDSDIRNTIEHLPHLCARSAIVIWTRSRVTPDLTPQIRNWFHDAGFSELAFVAVPGTLASVGVHRLSAEPRPFERGVRLFTFLPADERPSRRADQLANRDPDS
ncbi:MAG TPA: class I SAM-dependent methyltransferase [Candidatus Dormibacteraeota bacterium]|nr:class I SAM-dependent methyltransferase [Candidatus Dormibacteraeota bacterium]